MGFKVIIVGGSVSGLSLANMLEKLNIEYLILEAHPNIAPQLGASIGLLPGGLRILDQLGCYDRIKEIAGDCYYQASYRFFDGQILDAKKPTTFSERLESKTGYPQMFIDRQMLLQVLHDNLLLKDRVLTNKRVIRVDTLGDSVRVHTKDGSEYTGDIVVGADGVHSAVRKEMWRNALDLSPELFQTYKDDGLVADSKCIFGISKRPKSLPATPLQINAFFDGTNYLILSAPQDRLYWFLFQNMQEAKGSDIPRFTKDDEIALAKEHFNDQVAESTTFGDVYENRLHTALVSLEEHIFERWYFKRIITIGDAAHKFHPYTAQGGNGAMETAAILANKLAQKLEKSSSTLSESDIEAVFADVQASRSPRAVSILEQGRRTTSVVMNDTFFSRLFIHHLLPRFADRLFMWFAVRHAESGPVVERLPLPCRHGVTLPHAGTVKEPRGTMVPCMLGALVAAVCAVLLYSSKIPGSSQFLATSFKMPFSLL